MAVLAHIIRRWLQPLLPHIYRCIPLTLVVEQLAAGVGTTVMAVPLPKAAELVTPSLLKMQLPSLHSLRRFRIAQELLLRLMSIRMARLPLSRRARTAEVSIPLIPDLITQPLAPLLALTVQTLLTPYIPHPLLSMKRTLHLLMVHCPLQVVKVVGLRAALTHPILIRPLDRPMHRCTVPQNLRTSALNLVMLLEVVRPGPPNLLLGVKTMTLTVDRTSPVILLSRLERAKIPLEDRLKSIGNWLVMTLIMTPSSRIVMTIVIAIIAEAALQC